MAKPTINLLERFVYFRGIARELRAIRDVLEDLADSQRLATGQAPRYRAADPTPAQVEAAGHSPVAPDDYMTVYLIEELARDNHLRLDGTEDLGALALERGWMDPEGHFLVMPQSLQGR